MQNKFFIFLIVFLISAVFIAYGHAQQSLLDVRKQLNDMWFEQAAKADEVIMRWQAQNDKVDEILYEKRAQLALSKELLEKMAWQLDNLEKKNKDK